MDKEIKGRTGIITGASSGIGRELARELAKRGANVILVARRKNLLDQLAKELSADYGIRAYAMPADLASEEERVKLYQNIEQLQLNVDMLLNNAGFGLYGQFLKHDWKQLNDMLQVNIVALTHLTHLFVPAMVKRNWGRVMLISSTAAYQPVPTLGAYAATKSYVVLLGGALSYELKNTGVTCTVVSPGDTVTEFYDVSGQPQTEEQMKNFFSSEEVARIGVEAFLDGKPAVVTGAWNSFLAWGAKVIPDTWSAAVAYRIVNSG